MKYKVGDWVTHCLSPNFPMQIVSIDPSRKNCYRARRDPRLSESLEGFFLEDELNPAEELTNERVEFINRMVKRGT